MQRAGIETGRLKLRPLPAEAARLLPIDRHAAERIIGARLAPDWPGPDLFDVLPLQAAATESSESYGVWTITDIASETVIGDAGFMGLPDAAGMVEIGYSVIPSCRGKGVATEAVRALVTWAFEQPSVLYVDANCDPNNGPSVAVLTHVGFALETATEAVLRWRLARG